MAATADERTTLLDAEHEAWRAWELAVQAVRPAMADHPLASGRSTKEHAGHMAAWHRWGAARLADRIEGRERTRYPDWHAFEHDLNVREDERSRGRTWEDVTADASAAYAEFRARVEQLVPEQLDAERALIAACGSRHYAEYLDEIHALLDGAPPQAAFGTERLSLRSLRPADAPAIFEMFSDPEVMRYIPPSPAPLTLDRVRRGILRRIALERETGLTLWAVERKDTGEVIGQSGFALIEGTGPEIEIAYHYQRQAWGHGFATEAAIACLERGFGPLGLDRVIAICYPENAASWRVMEKAGMTFDGFGDHYGIHMKRYVADRATWRRPPDRRGSS